MFLFKFEDPAMEDNLIKTSGNGKVQIVRYKTVYVCESTEELARKKGEVDEKYKFCEKQNLNSDWR